MYHNSIATLKCGDKITTDFPSLVDALANWRVDKGYPLHVLDYWLRHQRHSNERALETLLGRFLMRLPYDATSLRIQQAIGASLYSCFWH